MTSVAPPQTTPRAAAPKSPRPVSVPLVGGVAFQAAAAVTCASVFASWLAIGASLAAAFLAAGALCIALPILGWFVALPVLAVAAFFAAMCWAWVPAMIGAAWACCAAVGALATAVGILRSR